MEIENLYINKIYDKVTNEIISQYDIKQISNIYSNTKTPIYKLIISDKEISRNNSLCVEYKCPTCGVFSIITLNIFLRKLNKGNTEYCKKCINIQPFKIEKQKESLLNPKSKPKVKSLSLDDQIQKSLSDWNNEDDKFQADYESKYITNDEFVSLRPKIISIGNDAIVLNDDWEYMYNFRVYNSSNQTKYNPVLINRKSNIVNDIHYIKFQCEECGEHFVNRDLYIQKNKIKTYCRDCKFCNQTFKIKHIKVFDTNIRYNSNYEKRFILWCKDNNIKINNGPCIEYVWNNSTHKYLVDFEVVDKKIIIELKDNHHWHKKNIEEGKFHAKNEYTTKWCKENNYDFYIAFPINMKYIKNKLLSL